MTCAAVILTDDNVLRNVNETSGKISGVSGLKCGIGKGLTCTTCRNEILEDVKTLTEVRLDRYLHGTSVGREHKSTHTCKLTHLGHVTSRTGVGHHLDRIVSVEATLKGCDDILGGLLPDLDDVVVTLFLGELTSHEGTVNVCNLLLCLCDEGVLFIRNSNVGDGDGDSCLGGILVAHALDIVENLSGNREAVLFDTAVNDVAELLLTAGEVDLKIEELVGVGTVNVAEILRDGLVEDEASEGSIDYASLGHAVDLLGNTDLDGSVKTENSVGICHHSLVEVTEYVTLAVFTCLVDGEIV